jgi:hypothetical protein
MTRICKQRRQFIDDVHILDLDLNAWLGQDQGFEAIREGGLKTEGTSPGVQYLLISCPKKLLPIKH